MKSARTPLWPLLPAKTPCCPSSPPPDHVTFPATTAAVTTITTAATVWRLGWGTPECPPLPCRPVENSSATWERTTTPLTTYPWMNWREVLTSRGQKKVIAIYKFEFYDIFFGTATHQMRQYGWEKTSRDLTHWFSEELTVVQESRVFARIMRQPAQVIRISWNG